MPVDPQLLAPSTLPEVIPPFRVVVERYAAFLWRALRHLGVREADVEDVCQEVFIVAHRRLPEFRGEASLRSWLYGIALRLASEYQRRAYVRREIPSDDPATSREEVLELDGLERSELRGLFLQALSQLDEDKRAVFVLYEIEELDMKEVSDAIGCPLQTAYSRLHAARQRLAVLLEDVEPAARARRGA